MLLQSQPTGTIVAQNLSAPTSSTPSAITGSRDPLAMYQTVSLIRTSRGSPWPAPPTSQPHRPARSRGAMQHSFPSSRADKISTITDIGTRSSEAEGTPDIHRAWPNSLLIPSTAAATISSNPTVARFSNSMMVGLPVRTPRAEFEDQ